MTNIPSTNVAPNVEVISMPWQAPALTPADMLGRALSQGASMEVLEKLMALQERWERNQARKAFDNALAAARGEFKPVLKNRTVSYPGRPGTARTEYRHEDLAAIARMADPILARHGLSYRWRTSSTPSEPITVTCIVSHRDGHSEENTLMAGRDDSGAKNGIQQVGSTITYLQRYSLKAALGLAAAYDDDGNGGGDNGERPMITDEQVDELLTMLHDSGADVVRFLAHLKLESLTEIYADKFGEVKQLILANAKRRAAMQESADV